MGAEQNHLCPVTRYSRDPPMRSARVTFARTSDPPCFSVMPMPTSTPDFSSAGANFRSYTRERMRGSHSRASSGSAFSAATAENVIEIGHVCPASFCAVIIINAARAKCAPPDSCPSCRDPSVALAPEPGFAPV